jgi:hypothetical protein
MTKIFFNNYTWRSSAPGFQRLRQLLFSSQLMAIADYFEKYPSLTIQMLANGGVRAKWMTPGIHR